MKQYKAKVIILSGTEFDPLKIGDIVTVVDVDDSCLVRLPKRLHGQGHDGNRYRSNNYIWLAQHKLEEIK